MDNEASTALKMTITSMKIKYQLVPTINHRENNSEIAIQPTYGKTIRCYQKKQQLNNWMTTIKDTPENCWRISILCWIHRPYNVDGTKITGGSIYKVNNKNRRINNLIF